MAALIRSAQILEEQRVLAVQQREAPVEAALTTPVVPVVEEPAAQVEERERFAEPLVVSEAPSEPERLEEAAAVPDEQARLASEREAEMQAARAQGYEEGYRHGDEEGRKAHSEALAALQRVAESIGEVSQGDLADHEDAIVEIAFEAICKIIGKVLQDRDGVAAVVRQVMSGARERQKIVIHVSPRDYAMLQGEQFLPCNGPGRSRTELVADDRVALGGCLVESPGGSLDGRLEIQLQLLRDVLLSARRSLSD